MGYTPDKQNLICKNEDFCYFDNAPTLAVLNANYDSEASVAWLIPQITDCMIFTNNKSVLSDAQIEMLASLIASEYYYLKLTELMLFFRKFKLGKYRQIYGNFSPMAITLSIREFLLERNDAYFKHESEIEAKKRDVDRNSGISYQEYLKLKEKNKL